MEMRHRESAKKQRCHMMQWSAQKEFIPHMLFFLILPDAISAISCRPYDSVLRSGMWVKEIRMGAVSRLSWTLPK